MVLTNTVKIYLILFHVLLGLMAFYFPELFREYYILFFCYGVYQISRKETEAVKVGHIYIAYWVGFEMLIRLSGAIFIDQFGKYGVLLLIFISFFTTKQFSHLKPPIFIGFIILLMVSMALMGSDTIARDFDLVSFYMSGPICLAFCVFYFNGLQLEFKKDFITMLFASILPIISIIVIIFIKAGGIDISSLAYGANSAQSGGFGPNQVSVILGYGMMVLFVGFLFRTSITGSFILDGVLLLILVYRILVTFSRGGFISPLIALVLGVLYLSIKSKSFIKENQTALLAFLIGGGLVFLAWEQTNNLTGNKLEERYEGYTGDTKYTDRREFSSGRDKLALVELEIFQDNIIMGVGPGMATKARAEKFRGGKEELVANHTEFSRMLAEHGLFGLMALLILLGYPLVMLRQSKSSSNSFILILLVVLSLLTQAHNAHRLALPSFLYGLAFVNLVKDRNKNT